MAKVVLGFVGPSGGLAYGALTSTGGGGGSGLLGGSIVTAFLDRPGYQLKFVNTGASTQGYDMRLATTALGGAATAIIVDRIYQCATSYPVGENSLWCGFADNGFTPTKGVGFRLLPTGFLEAGFCANTAMVNGAYAASAQSSRRLCPSGWYRIDRRLNVGANPWTLDWAINGEAQTQVTLAGAGTTWDATFVGKGINLLDNNATSVTVYATDHGVTNDTAQYPLGPAWSRIVLVTGYGTNVNAAAFRTEAGGAITGTNWARVTDLAPPLQDNVLPALANDGLSLESFGPFTNGDRLEFLFEQLALNATIAQEICAVQAWFETYRSASSPTNRGGLAVSTTSGGGGRFDAGFSTTNVQAQPYNPGILVDILRAVAPPAGGWTQSNFNTAFCRFGPTVTNGDAATRFYGLSWLALEVQLSSAREPYPTGCRRGNLPLMGVG